MGTQAGEILQSLLQGEKPESRMNEGVLVIRGSTSHPKLGARQVRRHSSNQDANPA
jgi:hypothetical protein